MARRRQTRVNVILETIITEDVKLSEMVRCQSIIIY